MRCLVSYPSNIPLISSCSTSKPLNIPLTCRLLTKKVIKHFEKTFFQTIIPTLLHTMQFTHHSITPSFPIQERSNFIRNNMCHLKRVLFSFSFSPKRKGKNLCGSVRDISPFRGCYHATLFRGGC